MRSRLRLLAYRLSSLWLTLACLIVAAGVALLGQQTDLPVSRLIAVPFCGLGLNLFAAIVTRPALRRQAGLLGFHIALAVLAILIAVDQSISLNGHVEVTEGTAFEPELVEFEAGPFHPWTLDRVQFVQGGFTIEYGPGVKRRETFSTILVPDGSGRQRPVVVGDDKPLIFGHYRFYTSFNKGFAPVLTYSDGAGRRERGAVHLPSYPLNHFKQGQDWALPDGTGRLKLWLQVPDTLLAENSYWQFRKPADATLIVIDRGQRFELKPGDSLAMDSGQLRYEELRSWMGYTISYNPVVPWILASAGLAVVCFAWHAARRMLLFPWLALDKPQRWANAH